jgi:RNA polymerase sigma-70 factor (ECF subfamily)
MDFEILGSLIDRLAGALQLYARQWCDDPEDVVQEAFAKLAQQHNAPRDPAAWLFRTVRNGAVNAGVARRRRSRHEAMAASARPWFEGSFSTVGELTLDPDAAQAALGALPLDQREVIVAHLWGGLTFAQIAGFSGSSSSSTHRLYHAGLSALRESLGVTCPTNPSHRATPR